MGFDYWNSSNKNAPVVAGALTIQGEGVQDYCKAKPRLRCARHIQQQGF
jgi:hypothetical protein